MKTRILTAVALLFVLYRALAEATNDNVHVILAKDAGHHIGETSYVAGTASEIFISSQTTNVYLYFDGDRKSAKFAILWPGTNSPPINKLEALFIKHQHILVHGKIVSEGRLPEIVVGSLSQFKVKPHKD